MPFNNNNISLMPHNFTDVWNWIISFSSGFGGATVGAIHDYFYSKKPWAISFAGWVIGCIFVVFLTEPLSQALPAVDRGFIGFTIGGLGKVLTKLVLTINYQKVVNTYISKKIGDGDYIEGDDK